MKPLSVGVIGLGVGEQHVRSYQEIPDIEVKAICDINKMHLKAVGQKYGIEQIYSDWKKITEHQDLDVVSVCSFDDFHSQQVISAFNHEKHVMVEKPVALNRADAESILRAQLDSGRFLSSNLILRQSPRFKALRREIAEGHFGEVFCIEGGLYSSDSLENCDRLARQYGLLFDDFRWWNSPYRSYEMANSG
jgi:predicted dehydrogenase